MKKIFMGAAVASLLFACSGESSDGFQLSIDIPSAGDSPVKVTFRRRLRYLRGKSYGRFTHCKPE